MAELPLVLCGPVLRRVDSSHVCVWIALSMPAEVTVHIFPGREKSTGAGLTGGPHVSSQMRETRSFGANLHVVAVDVEVAALLPSTRYCYDVVVAAGGQSKGLKDLGFLKEGTGTVKSLPLGYAPDMLPSFVTVSATVDGLRIAHTSCRKPHGPGPDALAWLDEVIEGALSNADEALQLLFLTGDQIYADDVAGSLLGALHEIGEQLLGGVEMLPVGGASSPATLAAFPVDRRQRTVRAQGKFTTTDGHSHLLTFGEYAAMYCSTWGPALWKQRKPATVDSILGTSLGAEAAQTDPTKWEDAKEPDKTQKARLKRLTEEHEHAEHWLADLPKVARVLANIPTFMIFDDHEITDDWNLTEAWRQRVINAPLGRSILRNGLMAYTVFQAWGNDPSAFRSEDPPLPPEQRSYGEKLLVAIGELAATPATPAAATLGAVDRLIGIDEPAGLPAVAFDYTVQGAMFAVRVLDTRTRRTYRGSRHSPPRLVGDTLDKQLPAAVAGDPRELLILVSPVPVLFPRLFEAVAQPVGVRALDMKAHMFGREEASGPDEVPGLRGTEKLDLEGWRADELHHEQLLARLATYPRAVVLSGDVHFASTLFLDYWAGGRRTRIVQCTASAAKNPWPSVPRAVFRGLRIAQQIVRGDPAERMGWIGEHGVKLPPGASIRPGRRGRLLRTPVILPADGWPPGTTLTRDPDWRWHLEVVRDERPRTELPIGAPEVPVLEWDASDPVASIARIAARHQQLNAQRRDPVRLMVFSDNVGVVTLAAEGADYTVTHTLLSADADGDGEEFTEHSIPFAPSPQPDAPVLRTV